MPPFARDTPYIQDLRKSREQFGFRTTPLRQWLDDTVRWYRQEYHGGNSAGYGRRAEEIELAGRYSAAQAALAGSLTLD